MRERSDEAIGEADVPHKHLQRLLEEVGVGLGIVALAASTGAGLGSPTPELSAEDNSEPVAMSQQDAPSTTQVAVNLSTCFGRPSKTA